MKHDQQNNPLDERWYGKPLWLHVREFSCILAIILFLIGAYLAYHRGSAATVAALVMTGVILVWLGYRAPMVLHPVWRSWMTLAMALGAVMTAVILGVAWTVVLLPIAVILKLCRVRPMDTSFDRTCASYWETRNPKNDDFKLLERQF